MSIRFKLASIALLGFAVASGSGQAALVGNWDFAGATPLVDSTGNFGTLQLKGTAAVAAGALDLSGSGTTSTGYAEASSYTGPSIGSKTMVVWGTLTALASSAYAGAMMSISQASSDQFDAIDYGERIANTWVSGSSYFYRTQDFSAGVAETAANLNTVFEIAFTYNFTGGGNETVTGYLNGVSMGSYTTGDAATWVAGNTIVGCGPRSLSAGSVSGGIDATVDAAQIYDTALTQAQIQGLSNPAAAPEPATLAVLGAGLVGLWCVRRRKVAASA